MKLIDTKTAPNPRRVRIFLAEKGVTVPLEPFEFTKAKLDSPEFGQLNSFRRVPVLVLDDGTAIAETVAICRYFEETHPAPALFGTGALGRAQVEMWQRRMELGLLTSVASAFRHLHPSMATFEVPQVPAWGEANKPRALEVLHILNDQLGHTRFVAGAAYSIADITAMVAIDFMRPARIERPALAHVDRWYAEVAGRPSAKA